VFAACGLLWLRLCLEQTLDWRSRRTPATDRHSVAPNHGAGIVNRTQEIDGTKLWAYVLRQWSPTMMDEMTIRMAIRATARISFVLFLSAFLGNALYRLVPASATRWLKANKDGFVLGFAASHTVHLAFILALVAAIGRERVFKGIMVVAFTTGSCSSMLWLLAFCFAILHSFHHILSRWRTTI
jgi:hypothetical protein